MTEGEAVAADAPALGRSAASPGVPDLRRGGGADPAVSALCAEVWAGLNRPQKELSPKHFYDPAGSALFDRITKLPEYYPTRAERALLGEFGRDWIAGFGARAIVELGAGSADKTRVLLDALDPESTLYVPLDISKAYLEEVGDALREEFPGLTVEPVRSDISSELHVPEDLPTPAVFAFLGSTIGNFFPAQSVRLLARVAAALRPDDRFLLGIDLKKDPAVLERAYNDAQGVTAAFNLNMLTVLNREAGTDFDPDRFRHNAFYDEARGRIEMHLVATAPQQVHVPGYGSVPFAAGESVRTEISTKYDRAGVERMFAAAGLMLEHWFSGDDAAFALVVARRGA
jgi:L-histidine Nalpha-methyltransferase